MHSAQHKPHKVAFLAYDNIQLLDLVGPLECFALVKTQQCPAYDTFILGSSKQIRSETGMVIHADKLLDENPDFDTLIIPGGIGARQPAVHEQIRPWLRDQFESDKRIICICTGVFLVADFPQIQGLTVTTHWDHASELQQAFPGIKVDANRLFIANDNFYSSAGVLSGIDLALNIIEQDHGLQTAASAAQYLVTYLKRSGHQSQFSDPLRFQSVQNTRLQKAHQWLQENLHKSISVTKLADELCISERQLNRLIQQHFNMTTKAWLDQVRLEQAKVYLSNASCSIKSVAFQVGYQSADSFRRAFKRKYGVEPSTWQTYFS